MKKSELLEKAKFILFPYANMEYQSNTYKALDKPIEKMPIIKDKDVLYSQTEKDKHHYTTEYHYTYVLPILGKMFNFDFNLNDFYLNFQKHEKYDCSFLVPKREHTYQLSRYSYGLKREICKFPALMNFNGGLEDFYHRLYRYPHQCSSIKNLDLKNGKKIFISGDSQTIPDIPVLSEYFEEVFYFDNRSGWKFSRTTKDNYMIYENIKNYSQYYENVDFSDVLVELYTNPLDWYIDINLR